MNDADRSSTYLPYLEEIPALAGLGTESLRHIAGGSLLRGLSRGQVLCEKGSQTAGFFCVLSGRIKLSETVDVDVAYHDPCYLGRTNGEYDAPRSLLRWIPGVKVREPELTRETSMCCGAGGGRMWLEEKIGERINQTRFAQLEASGTAYVSVACPYCWSMLSDAQRELGREEAKTWDVIELVARALPAS